MYHVKMIEEICQENINKLIFWIFHHVENIAAKGIDSLEFSSFKYIYDRYTNLKTTYPDDVATESSKILFRAVCCKCDKIIDYMYNDYMKNPLFREKFTARVLKNWHFVPCPDKSDVLFMIEKKLYLDKSYIGKIDNELDFVDKSLNIIHLNSKVVFGEEIL